jgi:hypothetical protein
MTDITKWNRNSFTDVGFDVLTLMRVMFFQAMTPYRQVGSYQPFLRKEVSPSSGFKPWSLATGLHSVTTQNIIFFTDACLH